MGLLGAIIVRPSMGEAYAYNNAGTYFDHEVMFLLTSMDPKIHQLAEQHRFDEIDMTERWPVYWFINGRAAPDDLADGIAELARHLTSVTKISILPYNSAAGANYRLIGRDYGLEGLDYSKEREQDILRIFATTKIKVEIER